MIKLAATIALAAAAVAAVPASAVTVVGATKVVLTSATPTWIQVAELQAFDFGSVNVALQSNGGVASASSVYSAQSSPDKANDGIFPSSYPDIFHSGGAGSGEFLQIDFAAPTTLASLSVYGRVDCCQERDLFTVTVYNAGGATLYSGPLDARFGQTGTVTFDAPVTGVPEASTWAMLIAGFGMTAAAMRRRRAVAA